MTIQSSARPVDTLLYIELQRFLFREAKFLDRRDYQSWLALLTDDVTYRVRIRSFRDSGAAETDYAVVDDGPVELRKRVAQISNARLSRAENPPSLTRRLITNVEAFHQADEADILVESSLLAFRTRSGIPEGGFYIGKRHDVLRRTGDGFQLACRDVRLDQTVLLEGALSILL